MRIAYRHVLPLLVLSLGFMACGKKAAPVPAPAQTASPVAATTAEAAAPSASLEGSWEGNSGPDLPISFTVEGQQVTSLSASYAGQQGSCSFNGNLNSDTPAAINGKSFSATGKSDDGTNQFTATGSFSSQTEASGTLVWKGSSTICGPFELNYKWTAKKSPPTAEE